MLYMFEAPDGAGKTTTMNKLYDILKELNIDVYRTEQPSKTLFNGKIRDVLLNEDTSKQTQLHLFMADRYKFYEKYEDIINSNSKVLLCDRSLMSSMAYQSGISKHIDKSMIDIMHMHKELLELNKPDRLFYLDLSIDEIQERMSDKDKNKLDSNNKNEIMNQKLKYSEAYKLLSIKWEISTIVASQPINYVVFDILNLILSDLNTQAMWNISSGTGVYPKKVKHINKNANRYKGEVYDCIHYGIYSGHITLMADGKIYTAYIDDYKYSLNDLTKLDSKITDTIYNIVKDGRCYK